MLRKRIPARDVSTMCISWDAHVMPSASMSQRMLRRRIAERESRMSNVFCGATDCKYNEDEYCTKNEISLYLIDILYKGCDDFEPKAKETELEQE